MHAGSDTTASKTYSMYYPANMGSNENGDTMPFEVPGPGWKDPSFLGFTKESK